MQEHFCEVCFCWFDPGGTTRKVCSDECKAERLKTRQTGISSRFVSLQRILRDEKIYWRDDRLIHSENFYAALIESGCTYCGVSLLGFSCVCLDRLDNNGKHNSWNVTPCCPTDNRIRSDEFSFEEMAQEIGPAIARVRARRAQNNN
jgi:hypothetical protein